MFIGIHPVFIGIIAAGALIIVINALSKTPWWERHICAEFPYEDECFSCNKLTCEGCSIPESGRPVLFHEE